MTREEAIKELKNIKENIFWGDEYGVCFRDEWVEAYEMAIVALREQDATDTNVGGKWISVEDRLPENKRDWVLVACKLMPEGFYGVPQVAELRRGVWWSERWDAPFSLNDAEVTHWMPLPEPPEVDV